MNCSTCKDNHYLIPDGKADFCGPCPDCNPEGKLRLAPQRKEAEIPSLPSDDDLFPFGKYKGRKYQDAPANYLVWLADQPWIKDWPDVNLYIETHLDQLEEEC